MSAMVLNTDVLLLLTHHLDLPDLLRLASSCKLFYSLVCLQTTALFFFLIHFSQVHDFGWSIFLRNNQRHSLTLRSSRSRWSPLAQVRYDTLADTAWSRANFIARPLSRPWLGSLQPVIALSVSTFLVAAGRILYSYAVRGSSDASPSRIVPDRSYSFTCAQGTLQPDITSIAFLPDAGQDRTVFVGFEDGSVEHVRLPPQQEPHSTQHLKIERAQQSILQHHGTANVVRSISCAPRAVLSLSQRGSVYLTCSPSGHPSSTSINLGARSWSSHLCLSSSSPYAAFGTTSTTPLSLYYLTPDGFPSTPSIILRSPKNGSAVYGITSAPPSSPLGPSQESIISGWYDGSVRIYDLRVSSHSPGSSSPQALLPVLTLRDPWSPEPIYSVSSGGGNASFVSAGLARHGIVAFWDVRQPSQGWSVHAPGNDSSPVYATVLESSRLFGATQSRPFVYDFGPGVTKDTYPLVVPTGRVNRRGAMEDRLNLEKNGIGYHVLKYSHRGMSIF